jgi:hypothetical protein
MKPKDRVFNALEHKIPDLVPLFEIWTDDQIAAKLRAENLRAAHFILGLDCMMIPSNIPPESNSWRTGTDEFDVFWNESGFGKRNLPLRKGAWKILKDKEKK